jgi:hypothetical protein
MIYHHGTLSLLRISISYGEIAAAAAVVVVMVVVLYNNPGSFRRPRWMEMRWMDGWKRDGNEMEMRWISIDGSHRSSR